MSTDNDGRFGPFGGRYIPETLMPAVQDLETAYRAARADPSFVAELHSLRADYAGRPTPLYYAERLSAEVGARVWLKREDLLHTGAHKINNTLGQALLARRMGKKRVIAETGAGQHGVATATVAAKFGMDCVVYMGEEDVARQRLNVFRMELLGAEVVPVSSGSRTLKDATNEAIRDWVTNVEDTFYIIGSVVGPHPYPSMVRDFHVVIGEEVREQMVRLGEGDPDLLVACVGGGSNAIGFFHTWIDNGPRLLGADRRYAGRIARGSFAVAAGRRWANSAGAFDFGGFGLSGGRPGACLAPGDRQGGVCGGHRRPGGSGFPAAVGNRGDHPRARVCACDRAVVLDGGAGGVAVR